MTPGRRPRGSRASPSTPSRPTIIACSATGWSGSRTRFASSCPARTPPSTSTPEPVHSASSRSPRAGAARRPPPRPGARAARGPGPPGPPRFPRAGGGGVRPPVRRHPVRAAGPRRDATQRRRGARPESAVSEQIGEIQRRLTNGLAKIDPHHRLLGRPVHYRVIDGATLEITYRDVPGIAEAEVLGVKRRSEEHTSELQSQSNLVCRLLLAK